MHALLRAGLDGGGGPRAEAMVAAEKAKRLEGVLAIASRSSSRASPQPMAITPTPCRLRASAASAA